jgi:DNA-binding winged helix-turn-helix (wHTH) protein
VSDKFVSEKPVSERPVIEKPIAQKKVCFDEFELDYGRFQLRRGSSAVKLEGLPLQLLMFLVDNKGQLVTREQIAAALWGKDVFVDIEQGINTAIRKIRMALEDDAAQPQYLQTIVGRGYRFIAVTSAGGDETAAMPGAGDGFMISPAELGRAIMSAAGLDPENPKAPPKVTGDS